MHNFDTNNEIIELMCKHERNLGKSGNRLNIVNWSTSRNMTLNEFSKIAWSFNKNWTELIWLKM